MPGIVSFMMPNCDENRGNIDTVICVGIKSRYFVFFLYRSHRLRLMACPISEFIKGKSKVAPLVLLTEHHAMKSYWRSGGIVPLIL